MSVKRLKIGVIGLGEVAQIIHLPIMLALPEHFEITAICDVSPGLLQAGGDIYNVPHRYQDARDLVAQPDLDAVFILNSDEYHAEHAILAADNGKHVLIEKPMCLTLREADEIIAARDAAGVQVMVAYMRRFAPAFTAAVDEVRQFDRINYARIRDIIGSNGLIIEQSSTVRRCDDIPDDAKADRAARADRLVTEAIGDAPPDVRTAYRMLLGLGSHDLSAMRELLGVPDRVIAATQWHDGRFMNVIFGYPGYNALFEMGVDQQRRFDALLEVYGPTQQLRVQYDTPYIRHLPTTLQVRETVGDAYVERIVRPTFKDPYTHELEHFHAVATGTATPKTTPEDFIEDLTLFRDIVDAIRHTEIQSEAPIQHG